MTIITEYRLKCDYCGNVSMPLVEHRTPLGWARLNYGVHPEPSVIVDFCCKAHRDQWQREYNRIVARPEPMPLYVGVEKS